MRLRSPWRRGGREVALLSSLPSHGPVSRPDEAPPSGGADDAPPPEEDHARETTMSRTNRLLVALGALLMVPAFFLPLWSIRLVAPQYPEGLGMYIGVTDIWGHDRHDLQNINILNHYIGMQEIIPEEVPELDIMPWVLGALILVGLVAALWGRLKLVWGWLLLLVVAGIAGMVDFWLWKHDYGHNLDPRAPIRVPDMTYQPPLIGTEQLLNITASSYPHWGSLFLALAGITVVMALLREHRPAFLSRFRRSP